MEKTSHTVYKSVYTPVLIFVCETWGKQYELLEEQRKTEIYLVEDNYENTAEEKCEWYDAQWFGVDKKK